MIGEGGEYNSLMMSALIVVSFLLSMCLTRILISPSSPLRVMDHPNERSLHTTPMPRSGGVAILIAFYVGTALMALILDVAVNSILLLSALFIAVISFLDDCYSLGPTLRFFIHFCASVLLIVNGYKLDSLDLPGWTWHLHEFIALGVSCFFIVWLTNLYNFMDGMDGFAAGMAIIGFSCFALLGWQAQHPLFMSTNIIIVSAVAGFLLFNFPPAKIFMGDTGSSTLGFLMAAFSLWASEEKIFPIWVALLVFSPFIVDASVTLLRRLMEGEKIWKAHKSHLYQRLVQAGWGHKRTIFHAYLLMLVCSATAWLAMQVDVTFQWMIVIGWIVTYIMITVAVVKVEHRSV